MSAAQTVTNTGLLPRAVIGANCSRERQECLSCLPSQRPQLSGSSAQLLQPRVFRFGLLEDRYLGVGFFPQGEEILVRGLGLGFVSR